MMKDISKHERHIKAVAESGIKSNGVSIPDDIKVPGHAYNFPKFKTRVIKLANDVHARMVPEQKQEAEVSIIEDLPSKASEPANSVSAESASKESGPVISHESDLESAKLDNTESVSDESSDNPDNAEPTYKESDPVINIPSDSESGKLDNTESVAESSDNSDNAEPASKESGPVISHETDLESAKLDNTESVAESSDNSDNAEPASKELEPVTNTAADSVSAPAASASSSWRRFLPWGNEFEPAVAASKSMLVSSDRFPPAEESRASDIESAAAASTASKPVTNTASDSAAIASDIESAAPVPTAEAPTASADSAAIASDIESAAPTPIASNPAPTAEEAPINAQILACRQGDKYTLACRDLCFLGQLPPASLVLLVSKTLWSIPNLDFSDVIDACSEQFRSPNEKIHYENGTIYTPGTNDSRTPFILNSLGITYADYCLKLFGTDETCLTATTCGDVDVDYDPDYVG